MRRYLAPVEREKPASRRYAVGAEARELDGGVEKFVEQPLGLVADDAARRGSGHDLVKNRKRPSLGVAHIAGNTREPCLEHQDADSGAIKRLAAPGDPRGLNHLARSVGGSLRGRPQPRQLFRCPALEPARNVAAASFAKPASQAKGSADYGLALSK